MTRSYAVPVFELERTPLAVLGLIAVDAEAAFLLFDFGLLCVDCKELDGVHQTAQDDERIP